MKTSAVVLVGYQTSPRDDAEQFVPDFTANSNVKDAEVARRQIAEKRGRFMMELATKPYLGQLETVYMALASDLDTSKSVTLNVETEGHLLGPSIANILYQWFPNHFDPDTGHYFDEVDPIRFIGFDVRNFVKLVGLECAEYGNSILPHALWYQADHRDMREAVLPTPEATGITLDVVIDRLRIPMPEEMVYEPGDDCHLDSMIAAECAARLNLFPFANKALTRIARALRAEMGMDNPTDNVGSVAHPARKKKKAAKPTARVAVGTPKKKKRVKAKR